MKKINIEQQLNIILKKTDKQLQDIADDICKTVKIQLQYNLKKHWYDTYNPKSYHRTWELFNSITGKIIHKKLGDFEIIVYFDTDKIYAVENDDFCNYHMGFDKQAFIDGLISSIEHGMKGSRINPRRGDVAHMVEFTQDWANQYARQLLKKKLL